MPTRPRVPSAPRIKFDRDEHGVRHFTLDGRTFGAKWKVYSKCWVMRETDPVTRQPSRPRDENRQFGSWSELQDMVVRFPPRRRS